MFDRFLEIVGDGGRVRIPLEERGGLDAEIVREFGRVFVQDGDTVLRVGDRVFKARPESGERYDAEKGLLVCLVKAMGLTTSDVIEMLDKAVVKNSRKKSPAIKRDKTRRRA